jgi:hypothetical protein
MTIQPIKAFRFAGRARLALSFLRKALARGVGRARAIRPNSAFAGGAAWTGSPGEIRHANAYRVAVEAGAACVRGGIARAAGGEGHRTRVAFSGRHAKEPSLAGRIQTVAADREARSASAWAPHAFVARVGVPAFDCSDAHPAVRHLPHEDGAALGGIRRIVARLRSQGGHTSQGPRGVKDKPAHRNVVVDECAIRIDRGVEVFLDRERNATASPVLGEHRLLNRRARRTRVRPRVARRGQQDVGVRAAGARRRCVETDQQRSRQTHACTLAKRISTA